MKMLKIEKFLVNNRWSKRRTLALARELLGFTELDGKQDFLEVGCGNGVVARYIARRYHFSVTGIDIDPQQIELARKDTQDMSNICFLEVDAASLPFGDNSFDVVLSLGVMQHVANWLDAVKEIKRVLRAGGYFIYGDIIYPRWLTRLDGASRLSFGLVTVRIGELNSFLKENSFFTVHESLTKSLIGYNYEAVYRRN